MKHVIDNLVPALEGLDANNYWSSPRDFEIQIIDGDRRSDHYNRFVLFGWDKDSAGRIEDDGSKVQGPYATMSIAGVSITAHKQEAPTVLEISKDDTLEIFGVEWKLKPINNGHFALERA